MIEIKTLGRTSVAVNGVPLTGEAAWPKSLALIVYMAREPGPDRREQILGVLWPDTDSKKARRALNQLIYTLRKASPELDLESVSDALDFGKEVWLDVEEFERLFEAGDLKGAVELYQGPFLSDVSVGEPEFDHWADRERAGLRRKFRRAALELAGQAKAAGDADQAVAYCQRLVEADPLDDEAQHLLIECLHARGDRLAALRHYEKYRELLARELEVVPLDHTRELIERIRGESAGGEPVAESTVEGGSEPAGDSSRMGAAGSEARSAERKTRRTSPIIELLGRRNLLGLAGLAVVVVAALWLWPWGGSAGPVNASRETLAAGTIRLAVLPFTPHGLRTEDDELSVGVAQLMSRNLDAHSSIDVVSHRTVLQAMESRGFDSRKANDPPSLSAFSVSVGATAIVLGDVHASGVQLRIVADVLDSGTGAILAESDVLGSQDTLFELLDELTAKLTIALGFPADTASTH